MALVYKDRVKQTVDAPSTTDPFDFDSNGATPTGYQSFETALADADTCIYAAEDASGNWETGVGTWAEAGKTLTRTTILASSNSGSAETFTGTVTVFISADASRLRAADRVRTGAIEWASRTPFVRTDDNTITVAAGEATVYGSTLTWAETAENYSSGTFPLDAAQMVYVYVANNSGADFLYSTTGPTWSQDLGYWYLASGTLKDSGGNTISPGTAGQARCIFAFIVWDTGAAKRVLPFTAVINGRRVCVQYTMEYINSAAATNNIAVVAITGQTNSVDATAFDFASTASGSPICVPSHAIAWYPQMRFLASNASDEVGGGVGPLSWAGNSGNTRLYAPISFRLNASKASEYPYFPQGRCLIETANTAYYGLDEIGTWVGNVAFTVVSSGWEIVI